MKDIAVVIGWTVEIVAIFLLGVSVGTPKREGVWIDCRVAEISPDYPVAVKNKCREIRR